MLEDTLKRKKPLKFRIQIPINKAEAPKNTVTLDFKPDKTTFGRFRNQVSPFHTFYKTTDSHSTSRHQPLRTRGTGRYTAFTDRESIIGTPISTLQVKDHEINVHVLPSFDRERYKYLLSALSGIEKSNQIPEFKRPGKICKKEKSISDQHSPVHDSYSPCIGSPRIVNMSADFQPSLRRNIHLDFENAFQKMFKNKRLLQKGRYNSNRQSPNSHFELLTLGDEELKVQQASIRARKQKKIPLV